MSAGTWVSALIQSKTNCWVSALCTESQRQAVNYERGSPGLVIGDISRDWEC